MSRKSQIKPLKIAETGRIPTPAVLSFGILAVASASILIRFAQHEAGSLVIAAYRMGLSGLILIPFVIPRHWSQLRKLGRQELALAALAGLFLALHFASWIQSLQYTSVASSVVLVTSNPLWVALLAPIFLRERVTPALAIGLLVALIGGIVIAASDSCTGSLTSLNCPSIREFMQGRAFVGDFLALMGAWMGAGYMLIGRKLRLHLSLTPYIFLVYGVAGLILIAALPFSGQPAFGFSPTTYVCLVLLALVPQLLGHSSFNWALAKLPATYVSIALLGEPIGATLLALLILGEVPSALKLLGATLILVGIIIATRKPVSD